MAIEVATPYDTAALMFGADVPTWLNAVDAQRLAAYALYENIYRNQPDTFKLYMRGSSDTPIYIPSARIIVNTINRYVCRGFDWVADASWGTAEQQAAIKLAFDILFKRTRFVSKFNSNKLMGLVRGDAGFLITGNAAKPEGARLDIHTLDPGTIFPIEDPDPNNKDGYIGVDVVEQIVNGDDLYVSRQRWLKPTHEDHPNFQEDPVTGFGLEQPDVAISYQLDSLEIENWEDPAEAKAFKGADSIAAELVEGITHLPVYWYNNVDIQDSFWGTSELQGLETVLAGINQAVSDQDMALAMAGLGMYVTDGGAPTDENGVETDWIIGPNEVIEVKEGKTFNRVKGIDSVEPSMKHIEFLQDQAFRADGASDVAQGRVEVATAESGIALQLRMGPILDESAQRDLQILDCLTQMFFDLRQWMEVYENYDFGDYDPLNPATAAVVVPVVGDKLPLDKQAELDNALKLYNALPAIVSGQYVRNILRKNGVEIPSEEEVLKQIADEAAFFTSATEGSDFADRTAQEAGDADPEA